jgi:predicted Zn-dependent protease
MKTLLLPESVIDLLPAALRYFIAISLFTILVGPVLAQIPPLLPDVMVEQFCHASQITDGTEFDALTATALRLAHASRHIHFAVINSPLINAWDVNLSAGVSLICIPAALVQFMGGEDGELAFILAHEIGHATDKRCKTLKARFRVAPLATLLGQISGDGAGGQKASDARADELGVNLMTRAGYDPNDAAVALQRISDTTGLSTTEPALFARLEALGEDHPITPDRVHHIRKVIAHAASCRDHTATCRGS